ncbi:MAG: hypothetical protein O4859_31960 [Trichodesmium sp. St18_bin1]|nr:hypothetical protein [Trichodesmium sp. St18_bin1]MDE5120630.1 hypothetical protein [Trichodesmium sp. St19_bin1]
MAGIARQIVTRLGIGDRLSPLALGRQNGNMFLAGLRSKIG